MVDSGKDKHFAGERDHKPRADQLLEGLPQAR
jgi:hypothetical protein